jgi:hypothetical protein
MLIARPRDEEGQADVANDGKTDDKIEKSANVELYSGHTTSPQC